MLGDEIELVAGEGDNDVFVCLALKLFYPGFGFIEGGLVEVSCKAREGSIWEEGWWAYGLCNVVDDDSAVGVSVIHGCKGFVAFLAGSIPYFEFDGGSVVEGDGLRQKSGANS